MRKINLTLGLEDQSRQKLNDRQRFFTITEKKKDIDSQSSISSASTSGASSTSSTPTSYSSSKSGTVEKQLRRSPRTPTKRKSSNKRLTLKLTKRRKQPVRSISTCSDRSLDSPTSNHSTEVSGFVNISYALHFISDPRCKNNVYGWWKHFRLCTKMTILPKYSQDT